jgi:hypothetical protein
MKGLGYLSVLERVESRNLTFNNIEKKGIDATFQIRVFHVKIVNAGESVRSNFMANPPKNVVGVIFSHSNVYTSTSTNQTFDSCTVSRVVKVVRNYATVLVTSPRL